jgi:uncharacterized protein (DUF2461 family)
MGEIQGERLARVPKGFPPDHPAGDLLRLKQAYFLAALPPSLTCSPRLLSEIERRLRLLAPFVAHLARVLGRSAR